MFDTVVEIFPVVSVALTEQSQKENETHFLSECSYVQVLTNTDLYFSKGRENRSFLSILRITLDASVLPNLYESKALWVL